MNERIMQFRVGVMILATILIAAILVLLFMGSSPLLHGTYTIYIKFSEAPGVTRDTPVRKAGIRIGRVRDVQFADDDAGVIVTAEIDRDRHLYSNEQCRATSSLLDGRCLAGVRADRQFSRRKGRNQARRRPARADGPGHDQLDCRPAKAGGPDLGRRSTRPATTCTRC